MLNETEEGDGDCYIANGDYIINLVLNDDKNKNDYRLCHGQVLGKVGDVKNRWFNHCWIEVNGDVLMDFSNNMKIVTRIDTLKHRIKLDEAKRYTPNEAALMMVEHETYGPWE